MFFFFWRLECDQLTPAVRAQPHGGGRVPPPPHPTPPGPLERQGCRGRRTSAPAGAPLPPSSSLRPTTLLHPPRRLWEAWARPRARPPAVTEGAAAVGRECAAPAGAAPPPPRAAAGADGRRGRLCGARVGRARGRAGPSGEGIFRDDCGGSARRAPALSSPAYRASVWRSACSPSS